MKCTTPDCTGEHESRAISHQVVYRERTLVIHSVPADVCPECGDVFFSEETSIHIDNLLRSKVRSKSTALVFGA